MNSIPRNGAEKPALQGDPAKCKTDIDQRMQQEVMAFYREAKCHSSSDSADSSNRNSVCNDSDYQTSFEDIIGTRANSHQISRNEIAEKLAELKIGYNNNLKSDSGTVDDMTSEDDLKMHSIIAGNSPANIIHHNSIQSIPDSRYSIILAGRLESKDNLFANHDERSLLNTAINESSETNAENQSINAELSRYVDSLEVQTEELSSSHISERDSLEEEAYCDENSQESSKARNILSENDENLDPNSLESGRHSQPRIISDKIVNLPIQLLKTLTQKSPATADSGKRECSKSQLNFKNDNVDKTPSRLDRTENRFNSLMTQTERLVIADIKSPNVVRLVEDFSKSSLIVGANEYNFGSDFITDICNLSGLGMGNVGQDRQNTEMDYSRDKIFERFSQQFAKAPTNFIEKLLTLMESSILPHAKTGNAAYPDVSLSRLTEEFRKICKDYDKRIEDETMPDFGFGPSFNASTATVAEENGTHEQAAASPFHNFTKLGGGRKVYRKTPRRVSNIIKSGTHCTTPNCANYLHRLKNNNSDSPRYPTPKGANDSTETFEFWENLCYEMVPTKHTVESKLSHTVDTGGSIYEDFVRKSDQQMASLEQSVSNDSAAQKADFEYNSEKRNSATTSKDCQEYCNSMKQKFIENLSTSLANKNPNNKYNHNEFEQILTAGLVEKRRKCFEEAQRAFEKKENIGLTKSSKPLDKASKFIDKNESSEAIFVSTLSACADYFDHVRTFQNHMYPMQCILECSERSESTKENLNGSSCMEYVQAVILPAPNRAKYRIQTPEQSPKNVNLIARTSLYLPGTPGTPLSKSPKGRSRLSPTRRHSPSPQSATVVSKKIKTSVSPVRKRSIRAAKPASHARVPRTPSITPELCVAREKHTPRIPSSNKLKPGTNSPGLMDVTNTKKRFEIPKLILTDASPLKDSGKGNGRFKIADENGEIDCQKQLDFSSADTPKFTETRYFYTPGKTPAYSKVRPKKKYFGTPTGQVCKTKAPANCSPGSYRVNYNTVQSPVGMYIRGTNPDLITNVKGKTNQRMLTPRAKTPRSEAKVASPILARSPCLSPKSTESSRLKFQLTPAKRQRQMQESDILNMALCESDPSSNIGSGSTSNLPYPRIFYKPAPSVKMVTDDPQQKGSQKVLVKETEEKKMIYCHKGRLKSGTESKAENFQADGSTKDSMWCDSRDISLLHQRSAVKSNYLFKK